MACGQQRGGGWWEEKTGRRAGPGGGWWEEEGGGAARLPQAEMPEAFGSVMMLYVDVEVGHTPTHPFIPV